MTPSMTIFHQFKQNFITKSCNSLELYTIFIPQKSAFTMGLTLYGVENPQLEFDIRFGLKTHKIDYNATFNR